MVTPSDEKILQEFPNLIYLKIISSQLRLVIPLSENILELTLRDNGLLNIPKDFLNVSKLLELKISENRFHDIPDLSMIRNTIQVLNLSKNNIQNTSNLYGIVFPKLRGICLSNNMIEKFIFQAFRFWPTLADLDLKWNRIKHLELVTPYENIMVHAQGNPLNCYNSQWMQNCWKMTNERTVCHDTYTFIDIACKFFIKTTHSPMATTTSDDAFLRDDLYKNLIITFVVQIANTVLSF